MKIDELTIPLIYCLTWLIILWRARKLHLSGEWGRRKKLVRKCLVIHRIKILRGK